VATAAISLTLGGAGAAVMAGLIIVSTFGCNNGMVLSGARVLYAMGRDGLFFAKAGQLNPRGVPAWALWAQGIWASVLCLSGTYGDLLDYVIATSLLFHALTVLGVFVMRGREPEAPRPYKTWGYPLTPALYVASALFVSASLLQFKPAYTWPGLLIVFAGVPVYYLRGHWAQKGQPAA
jgi:APA family basic amino acid/polyamine antiporter